MSQISPFHNWKMNRPGFSSEYRNVCIKSNELQRSLSKDKRIQEIMGWADDEMSGAPSQC